MSFNFSQLTQVSVLTLSALSLSVMSGCSNGDFKGASQAAAASEAALNASNADPFDSYYGSPKKASHDKQYRPKLIRKGGQSPFKASAPKRYVVKKGDTLWGISNKFLKNPAYWPEVWDKNQKVRNPHRIYPGDVLFIYQGRGKGGHSGHLVEKLVPQMRVIRNGGGEPISTLSPFLAWPRVLDEDAIKNAPYIVDGREGNILMEVDQTVYVKNLKDRHAGGEYAIFNVGKTISDPKSGKNYGKEVTYNGFLNVDRPALQADVASATIVESQREIKRGDRLLYIEDETHNLKAPITMPKHKVRGDVISLFDAEMISAQSQIITINKGARQGIKAGYTLGVYSLGKLTNDPLVKTTPKHRFDVAKPVQVTLPPERAATAIVYKVLNDISYAVITDSSHTVKNGYKIGNP